MACHYFISSVLMLSACTPVTQQLIDDANQLAEINGFTQRYIQTDHFNVYTLSRVGAAEKTAAVYIEGDGHAWMSRTRVSLNPTPREPLALKLAAVDRHHENVFYIARPCQFLMTAVDPACSPEYWTSQRYSQAVVDSLNEVLNQLKVNYQMDAFHLVGFSGGAAIAVLLAATRNDVLSIRSVAGNLDSERFTEWHQVSPLKGSLNPADYAEQVATIPQRHFIGADDTVVPALLAESYRQSVASPRCIHNDLVVGVNHLSGWIELWPVLLNRLMSCAPLH